MCWSVGVVCICGRDTRIDKWEREESLDKKTRENMGKEKEEST